jgi:hypothetical protein
LPCRNGLGLGFFFDGDGLGVGDIGARVTGLCDGPASADGWDEPHPLSTEATNTPISIKTPRLSRIRRY